MITRPAAHQLLEAKIQNPALRHHCVMVAAAMEACAATVSPENTDLWYVTGLLHDLDWELHPDEHPNRAVNEWLPALGAPPEMLRAIQAHAPARTGVEPETQLDCYLFANDELSGFMNAVSLMRPDRFAGMEARSVLKKLKDLKFAANVSREDIQKGAALIGKTVEGHITFLAGIFAARF